MCKGGIEKLFEDILHEYERTVNALNSEMSVSVEAEMRLNAETKEQIEKWEAELRRLLMRSYYAVPSEFQGDQYDRQEAQEKYGISGYALDWAIVDEDGKIIAATGAVKIPSQFDEKFAMDEEEKDQVIASHFNGNPFPSDSSP